MAFLVRASAGAIGLLLVGIGSPAGALEELLPPADRLTPLRLSGPVERYDPETLWEKIDGEAELYRRFGLERAVIAYYEDPDAPERGLEVSLFGMAEPLGAYGLFAEMGAGTGESVGLGNAGVGDDYRAVFWQGRVFGVLQGYGSREQRILDLGRAVAVLSERLRAAPPMPTLLAAFREAVRAESVRFYPDHLLSRELLPPGLAGEDAEGRVLFASHGSPPGGELLERLGAAWREAVDVEWGGSRGVSGVDPSLGPMTALIGADGRLVGVRALSGTEGIGEALRRLMARLPLQSPEADSAADRVDP